MKKIVSFFLLFCILSGFIIAADAADISFTAAMDSSEMELIIKGQCDTQRELTFYVTDTDISAAEITFNDNIYAMEQITSEKDGTFSAVIPMPDNLSEGSYKVIAGGVGTKDESQRSAVFTYQGLENFSLWLEAEEAELTGNYNIINANEASGGKRIAVDSADVTKSNTAAFNFSVPAGATYDIWVLSTLGNVTYTSRYLYDFDGQEQERNNNDFIEQVYNTNDIRQVGVGWAKLSEKYLDAGSHTLNFSCDTKRELENDFIYHVLDTVVIVPKNWNWKPNRFNRPYNINNIKINYVSGLLNKTSVSRGGTLDVVIQAAAEEKISADLNLWAAMVKDGEYVSSAAVSPMQKTSQWAVGKNYLSVIKLNIPEFAPDAEYEIVAGVGLTAQSGFNNTSGFANVGKVTLGSVQKPTPESVTVSDALLSTNSGQINAEFILSETNCSASAKAFVKLWKGDVLWGTAESYDEIDLSKADIPQKIQLSPPKGIPAGEYIAELGFYNVNGSYKCGTVSIEKEGWFGYKPLSNGVYISKKTGREHFWYVNQENTLIWDGEPYIPIGGMECLSLITSYSNNQKENANMWAQDKKELDILAEKGVKDLYINAVGGSDKAPNWVWEFVLDYLDKKGFRYSIQTNAGQGSKMEAYYVRSNPTKSPIAVKNITQSGTVTKTVSLSSMESYGEIEPVSGLYALVNSAGNAVSSGICDMKKNGSGYEFSADITLPSAGKYSVCFTPRVIKDNAIMINFWDCGDESLKYAEKFSKIPAGDGFRSIIDPLRNESGYYNGLESIRPYGEAYNAIYSRYLKELYISIEKLNNAWKAVPRITDFETASRIIPVYTGAKAENYSVFGFDERSGKMYTFDGRHGVMWNDYLNFRDESTAEFYNKTADAYKKELNVPVIVKNVWGHKEYFINKKEAGGLDGLGTEAYGNYGRIADLQTSCYGMVNQFAKTAWSIVTETSTEEDIGKKYESGQFGYESESYMHGHFDTLMEYGAKGIFDFLFSARHNEMTHVTYSYINKPEQFDWMNNYINKLDMAKSAEYIPDKNKVFLMPHNSNYYTSPNRYTSVLYDDSYKAVNQSFVKNNMMLMLTEDADISAGIIAANFENGPASDYQGKKFSKMLLNMPAEKQAVYLGMRYDLGTVPEVDKYFTNEFGYNSAGVKVQILNPPKDAQIRMTDAEGRPWAIRDGNFWIVAAEDCISAGSVKYLDEIGIFMDEGELVWRDCRFEDENGAKADTLGNGAYTFKAQVKNNAQKAFEASIILALYDNDGRLEKTEVLYKDIVEGLNNIEVSILSDEKDSILRTFIWDEDMKSAAEIPPLAR